MRKSSVSKQSKHSSYSSAVIGRASASRRANCLCQRATSGAPSAMRCAVAQRLGRDLVVGHDARDEPLVLRFLRVEDPALRAGSRARRPAPTSRTSGAISGYAITRPRFLIGAPKRLDVAADAQVAQRGDLEAAADADAVDLRDQRMAARGERARRRVHHVAVLDRLRLVRALGRELARCRCRARTPSRRRRAR